MSALQIPILNAVWQTFDENSKHHVQNEMVKKQRVTLKDWVERLPDKDT
jgi:hypothetical protein